MLNEYQQKQIKDLVNHTIEPAIFEDIAKGDNEEEANAQFNEVTKAIIELLHQL